MSREALLLVHPTFGVLAAMAALWVLVEVIQPDPASLWRIKTASVLVAMLLVATWLGGGLWDEAYFDADRDFVEKGSWAFIGNTGMEMKEHLFPTIMLLGQRWTRLVRQLGGLAKVDSGSDYAANFSCLLSIA